MQLLQSRSLLPLFIMLCSSVGLLFIPSPHAIAKENIKQEKTEHKSENAATKTGKSGKKNSEENSQNDEAVLPIFPDYQDDRSTPEKLIKSYYNAINRHEIARAYSYYSEEGRYPFYDKFAKGYEDTRKVKIILGKAQADGAAGTIYWILPLAIEAEKNNGKSEIFTGCYTIRQVDPGIQAIPPFRPMEIMSGTLSPSPLTLEKSVPDSCEAP